MRLPDLYDAETALHEHLELKVARAREAYTAQMLDFARTMEIAPPLSTWATMLMIEKARRQYHAERKLSEQLGFDIVDIGGEG